MQRKRRAGIALQARISPGRREIALLVAYAGRHLTPTAAREQDRQVAAAPTRARAILAAVSLAQMHSGGGGDSTGGGGDRGNGNPGGAGGSRGNGGGDGVGGNGGGGGGSGGGGGDGGSTGGGVIGGGGGTKGAGDGGGDGGDGGMGGNGSGGGDNDSMALLRVVLIDARTLQPLPCSITHRMPLAKVITSPVSMSVLTSWCSSSLASRSVAC